MKHRLLEGPRQVWHRTKRWRRRRMRQNSLRRLADLDDVHAKRLPHLVSLCQTDQLGENSEILSAVEERRRLMLLRDEPLIDGWLGAAGPYDKGVSIRRACKVSKDPRSATFLHLLVREFKPLRAIELGTNVGISAAYQAAALKLNGRGALMTLEASPYRLRLAKRLHAEVGLDNIQYRLGSFTETLAGALKDFGPVGYAFIDGHHQYQPTLDYFEMIWKHAVDRAVIVLDDIRWSEDMKRAWRRIQTDARVAIAIDFHSVGVCITRQERSTRGRHVSRKIHLWPPG
jgi:predicted O-methyltransferase YrrM